MSFEVYTLPSPIGYMFAVADNNAIYRLKFTDQHVFPYLLQNPFSKPHPPVVDLLVKEIEAYFEGKLKNFTVPIKPFGPPLRQLTWKTIQATPYGTIATYGSVAKDLGSQGNPRAVGGACRANDFLIIIPCHRIIGSDGSLGGYSAGPNRKEWLIAHERKHARNRPLLTS